MCIFWCLRLRVVCQQESPAVPLVSFQTPTNEFLLYSHWPAQRALNGKPQRHWLFSLHVLTEMEMSLSSFLMGFVRLCVIMNALFLTSCPAHPYPSHLPVSLCLPLSPSFPPSLTCSLISCLSRHLVELKEKPWGQDVAQTSLQPACQWLFAFGLFVIDWRQKPATPREAGAGWTEAAANHPQGRDSAWGGGRARSEGSCPHKGTSTCPPPRVPLNPASTSPNTLKCLVIRCLLH